MQFKPRNSTCTWQNLPSVNAGAAQVPSVQQSGQRAALILGLLVAVGSFCFLLHKDSFFRAERKCVCHSAPLKTQTEDLHKQKAISASSAWHLCNTFYNIKVCAILSLCDIVGMFPAFQCLPSDLLPLTDSPATCTSSSASPPSLHHPALHHYVFPCHWPQ